MPTMANRATPVQGASILKLEKNFIFSGDLKAVGAINEHLLYTI